MHYAEILGKHNANISQVFSTIERDSHIETKVTAEATSIDPDVKSVQTENAPNWNVVERELEIFYSVLEK